MSLNHIPPPPAQAFHRAAPVECPCGRTVERKERRQRFCSDRCRERERGNNRTRKAGLGGYTGAPRTPPKLASEINALHTPNRRPRPPVSGPVHIVEAELFAGHWERAVSDGGVVTFVRPKVRP